MGFEPTPRFDPSADFKSAASAVPPRGQRLDSTGVTAILEALNKGDWGRLGVLLGAHDPILAAVLAAWPTLSNEVRQALALLAAR